jgi:hypothetical protein
MSSMLGVGNPPMHETILPFTRLLEALWITRQESLRLK